MTIKTWRERLSELNPLPKSFDSIFMQAEIDELRAAAVMALAQPVQPATDTAQRAEFDAWWEEFSSTHEEWKYADSSALRWAAWQAAQETQPVQPANIGGEMTVGADEFRDALFEFRKGKGLKHILGWFLANRAAIAKATQGEMK